MGILDGPFSKMDNNAEVERIEQTRAELLGKATRIVQAAAMAGRFVSGEEDARVLALVTRVRGLERQLGHLKRHYREDDQTQYKDKTEMTRTHYLAELESVRRNLVEMGETTLTVFDEAVATVFEASPDRLARASELEIRTDKQHRAIHDRCLNLITLQAPVAKDARFVTGALDAIVDLELIGDYAYEIASLASGTHRRPPSQVLAQIFEIAQKVRAVLANAVDAWRHEDSSQVPSVRSRESAIRKDYRALLDGISHLTSGTGEATMYPDLILVSRHLEGILRHAVCVAEQAIGAAPLERPQGL